MQDQPTLVTTDVFQKVCDAITLRYHGGFVFVQAETMAALDDIASGLQGNYEKEVSVTRSIPFVRSHFSAGGSLCSGLSVGLTEAFHDYFPGHLSPRYEHLTDIELIDAFQSHGTRILWIDIFKNPKLELLIGIDRLLYQAERRHCHLAICIGTLVEAGKLVKWAPSLKPVASSVIVEPFAPESAAMLLANAGFRFEGFGEADRRSLFGEIQNLGVAKAFARMCAHRNSGQIITPKIARSVINEVLWK